MTAKYSAGYLQRKKMFSSKKENKDILNIKNTNNNVSATVINDKPSFINKGGESQRNENSKVKKQA